MKQNKKIDSILKQINSLQNAKSIKNLSRNLVTACNLGQIIPIYIKDTLPGDLFNIKNTVVIRMDTLVKPAFVNMKADISTFWVPNELIMEDWYKFITNASPDPTKWESKFNNSLPCIKNVAKGEFTDAKGVKYKIEKNGLVSYTVNNNEFTLMGNEIVNVLAMRAYHLIWNYHYRNEGEQMETPVLKTAGLIEAKELEILDTLKNSNRIRDYFSKGKRKQQILDNEQLIGLQGDLKIEDLEEVILRIYPEITQQVGTPYANITPQFKANASSQLLKDQKLKLAKIENPSEEVIQPNFEIRQEYSEGEQIKNKKLKTFTENSIAKLSDTTGIKLSDLRKSLAINHYYEKLAEEGNQKDDFLLAIWGIRNIQEKLRMPVHINTQEVPIMFNQVVQTAGSSVGTTNTYDPNLGAVGAVSLTNDTNSNFAFTTPEHGQLITLLTIRQHRLYSNGIEIQFLKGKDFSEFYNPLLKGLSKQEIRKIEIYAKEDRKEDEGFNFKDTWQEYCEAVSNVHPEMRSGGFELWNNADDYSQNITFSDKWLQETAENLDKLLAIPSKMKKQFWINTYSEVFAKRQLDDEQTPGIDTV